MKKIVISILLALMLVATMAIPVMAETSNLDATVTVTEYASVTITDNGAAGLLFGSLTPGTVKQPEAASPSVNVTAASENNIDVDIRVSGTDFSDGGTEEILIGNAFLNATNDSGSATAMSTSGTVVATLSAEDSVDIYHWLSIPAEQAAATYTSTFTYLSE